ncbi:hypothetical protein G5I_04308 [Acromyrmex echinatior]|uniref:Uncharacterized protein n=1 Tax=Acromyrmex echinatior TaxID=103372 RepID=F4WFA1_ACREC|nr:hypothetical protein G5I_04308 [Acromyrmex echinatior]
MSSGAKRLVQSLRGRTGGRGTGGGRSDAGAGEDSGVGGGGASTSATRLCHYDSGHELDEISVIGATVRDNEGLTTPTTPCHCRSIKYGSGQTLCSIAGLPPAPAIPAHRAQSDLDIKLRLPLNDHDDGAIRAIVVDFGNIFDRKREKLYVSL